MSTEAAQWTMKPRRDALISPAQTQGGDQPSDETHTVRRIATLAVATPLKCPLRQT